MTITSPRSQETNAVTSIIRSLLISVTAISAVKPSLLQPFLDSLWAKLRSNSFYSASYFETIWTVGLYAVFITSYELLFFSPAFNAYHIDRRPGNRDKKPIKKRSRGVVAMFVVMRLFEIVEYAMPLLLLDLTMIKKYSGVSMDDIAQSGGYSLGSGVPNHLRQTFLVTNFHNFTMDSPVQAVRALPLVAPSARRIITELVISLFIYDFLFFLSHLALHRIPFLYKHVHESHHSHGEIHARVTNRLDLVERLILVLSANFALNVIGSHVLTRTIFVIIFVALLVENHSGLSVPWGYDKILGSKIASGSRRHAAHHRYGRVYFQPFLRYADDLLEWYDRRKLNEPS